METPPATPRRPGLIETLADLLRMASDWLRQEAEEAVREKLIAPLQRLGVMLASAQAAGCLMVLALIFIAVGLFMLLGGAIGYPSAFLLVGGFYVVLAVVAVAIGWRSMQK